MFLNWLRAAPPISIGENRLTPTLCIQVLIWDLWLSTLASPFFLLLLNYYTLSHHQLSVLFQLNCKQGYSNLIPKLYSFFNFFFFSDAINAMDWAFVHKTWDKWASTNIGYSGQQHLAFKPRWYAYKLFEKLNCTYCQIGEIYLILVSSRSSVKSCFAY